MRQQHVCVCVCVRVCVCVHGSLFYCLQTVDDKRPHSYTHMHRHTQSWVWHQESWALLFRRLGAALSPYQGQRIRRKKRWEFKRRQKRDKQSSQTGYEKLSAVQRNYNWLIAQLSITLTLEKCRLQF